MIRGIPLEEIVSAGWAPSVRWLREAIRDGRVPGRRVARKGGGGRCTYVMTPRDLDEFIESRRVVPTVPSRTGLNLTPAAERRLVASERRPA